MEIKIPGKTCIVIRANSRIGYAIVEGLAKQFSSFSYVCFWNFVLLSLKLDIMINETVYLVCRNKERGEAALSDIQTKTGNQNVYLEVLLFLSCISIY